MEKTILESVIDDIKSLRGGKVSMFGQPTTLPTEVGTLEIDVVEVLESFLNYEKELKIETYDYSELNDEYGYTHIEFESVHEYLERLDELGEIDYINYKADNTYNWASPISNHLDFKIYRTEYGGELVECKVHRYGDVRANYTDTFLLEFSHEREFLELLLESNKYFYIEIDNVTYDIEVDIFRDVIEVSTEEGTHIGEFCCYELDDLKKEIRECIS